MSNFSLYDWAAVADQAFQLGCFDSLPKQDTLSRLLIWYSSYQVVFLVHVHVTSALI